MAAVVLKRGDSEISEEILKKKPFDHPSKKDRLKTGFKEQK
jgi:hypothetical protein